MSKNTISRNLNLKRYSSGFRLDVVLNPYGDQIVRASGNPNWSAARAKEGKEELYTYRLQISDALVQRLHELLVSRKTTKKHLEKFPYSEFLDL